MSDKPTDGERFHCAKLCSGPYCAPLRYALNASAYPWATERLLTGMCPLATDPAKLAELLVLGGKVRGLKIFGSNVFPSHCGIFVLFATASGAPFRRTLTIPEARALLAAIMATPADESSREQIEALFRG